MLSECLSEPLRNDVANAQDRALSSAQQQSAAACSTQPPEGNPPPKQHAVDRNEFQTTLIGLARFLTACLPFRAPSWEHPGTVPQALRRPKAEAMRSFSASYSCNRVMVGGLPDCGTLLSGKQPDCDNIYCPLHIGCKSTVSDPCGGWVPCFCSPACQQEGEDVLKGHWRPQ